MTTKARSTPSAACPRNDLMRFCGCLNGVDARAMRAAQEDFSKIEDMISPSPSSTPPRSSPGTPTSPAFPC